MGGSIVARPRGLAPSRGHPNGLADAERTYVAATAAAVLTTR